MILEELEDERRWDESFARSLNLLANLQPRRWRNILQGKRKN
ncbi:MAG: hypothetical protein QQW96_25475 [Tychonema bourrellyi B0820]|nr:hypothetical protein [Tychonema bourrellyi]MDQ2100983.1 hypothetical protein [Tychonema bourrellyi B0820]